nr:MAG TPA: hypothetical protein [Caudoviricetes sp.]
MRKRTWVRALPRFFFYFPAIESISSSSFVHPSLSSFASADTSRRLKSVWSSFRTSPSNLEI